MKTAFLMDIIFFGMITVAISNCQTNVCEK